MSRFYFTRRFAIAGLVCVLLGALASRTTLAQSLGMDVWNYSALQKELRAGEDQSRELNERSAVIAHRIAVKDTIVADLLAGKITLATATDRFLELNAGMPEYMDVIRSTFAGDTDHERTARNVISFAVAAVRPDDRPAVASRLESQLHDMTGSFASE